MPKFDVDGQVAYFAQARADINSAEDELVRLKSAYEVECVQAQDELYESLGEGMPLKGMAIGAYVTGRTMLEGASIPHGNRAARLNMIFGHRQKHPELIYFSGDKQLEYPTDSFVVKAAASDRLGDHSNGELVRSDPYRGKDQICFRAEKGDKIYQNIKIYVGRKYRSIWTMPSSVVDDISLSNMDVEENTARGNELHFLTGTAAIEQLSTSNQNHYIDGIKEGDDWALIQSLREDGISVESKYRNKIEITDDRRKSVREFMRQYIGVLLTEANNPNNGEEHVVTSGVPVLLSPHMTEITGMSQEEINNTVDEGITLSGELISQDVTQQLADDYEAGRRSKTKKLVTGSIMSNLVKLDDWLTELHGNQYMRIDPERYVYSILHDRAKYKQAIQSVRAYRGSGPVEYKILTVANGIPVAK